MVLVIIQASTLLGVRVQTLRGCELSVQSSRAHVFKVQTGLGICGPDFHRPSIPSIRGYDYSYCLQGLP